MMRVREHPAQAAGLAITAAFILMPGIFRFLPLLPLHIFFKLLILSQHFVGPRRFLFRHTLGRLQSEEVSFSYASFTYQYYR